MIFLSTLSQDGLSFSRTPKAIFRNAIFLVSFASVLTGACISNLQAASAEDEISFAGEVRWISVEGGFFGLVAEDGRKFSS
jgi:hypothetical protein